MNLYECSRKGVRTVGIKSFESLAAKAIGESTTDADNGRIIESLSLL